MTPSPSRLVVVNAFGVATTDAWSVDIPVWRGAAITIAVSGNPIDVQLALEDPPAPPLWGRLMPILGLPVSTPWQHAGPFGYFRVRSHTAGAPATIDYTAYGGDS